MFPRPLDWLNDRTGYRTFWSRFRDRTVPGGPSWWRATASCLLWLLAVQVVTGFVLMTAYSPSTTGAWASVHFIEQDAAGAFLRGLHYFAAQAMIVLLAVHVVRVFLAAAFRAPRELIWITGLVIFPLVILWAITGNPLSGSQKGFAQIDVEGNIIASTPLVGPFLQRVLIGGDEVGQLTLTHLYFLHVAFLPLVVFAVLAAHLAQVYRHGLSPQGARRPAAVEPLAANVSYWPHQTVRNMTVLAALLGVLAWLAWRFGAPLDAPANPELAHSPRPEWYFRSLFELRRYFTGEWEFVATVVIPLATLGLLLALPLIDHACSRRKSLWLRVGILIAGGGGCAALTFVSLARDWSDEEHLASAAQSEAFAVRARVLADQGGVPPEGASALLRNDPKTQGPVLFDRHCASCHDDTDIQGQGIAANEPSAANLHGFASRAWLVGLLDPDQIASSRYFGKTKFADGEMAQTIRDHFDSAASDEEKQELRAQLEKIAAALSAEAALPDQAEADRRDAETIAEGAGLLAELSCTDCHRFHDEGELGSAPDLTGYGSREWLAGIISNPAHERFYADDRNDRMPAFSENADEPAQNRLTRRDLDLLVAWLRGEWLEPEPSGVVALPRRPPAHGARVRGQVVQNSIVADAGATE